ncbi:MAG: glycosyltransferase family 9 protein [Actinomycetota bacterium]
MSRRAPPVLLAYRALGLGDLLTAVPALRALADAFAGHRRVLAAPQALAPLALGVGVVDEVIDARPFAPLPVVGGLDVAVNLPGNGLDVAVNLHGRGPQSHRVLLAAEPRRLIAFAHHDVAASRGGPRWRADEHEVGRWCRLLEESGVPADPRRLDIDPPARPAPPAARAAVLIHPGAASPARRWPVTRWATVARALRVRGKTVVVSGGRNEIALAHSLAGAAGLPRACVLAGATDVLDLAAPVAAADAVLCGDTGVAHLATALGTPSVVLFGPSSPGAWGPPPDRRRHRVLWSRRTGDPHGSEIDRGLLAITEGDVLEALEQLESESHLVGARPGGAA